MENYCRVTMSGIVSEINFSHERYREKFYEFTLSCARESGTADNVKCIVSKNLLPKIHEGKIVQVIGTIRTYNRKFNEGTSKLIVTVFVEEIYDAEEYYADINNVELVGYISNQKPVRETPLGKTIADIIVAVNRTGGKSSYIPTIAWGRTAKLFNDDHIGELVKIFGRFQSREYLKRYEDGHEETKTAYELSVITIEFLKEEVNDESEN